MRDMRKLLVCAFVVAGCASSGQPAVHYSGEPFDLASRGTRITGQVCGMDLTLDVTRRDADAVQLEGFIDGRFPVLDICPRRMAGHEVRGQRSWDGEQEANFLSRLLFSERLGG